MTTPPRSPIARPEVRPLKTFGNDEPEERETRRLGAPGFIQLGFNENPYGPSERVRQKLAEIATKGLPLGRYTEGASLREAIAAHHGLTSQHVVLGNGSDEIFLMIALAYICPGDVVLSPTWEFFRFAAQAAFMGAKSWAVSRTATWQLDPATLIDAIDPSVRVVFISNPTNPLGTLAPNGAIQQIVDALPPTTLFVIDQAYHEYVEDDPTFEDATPLVSQYPNVIVTRTFSKVHGLAGLRIGYAIVDPSVRAELEKVRPIYNGNTMALAAAEAALTDMAHARACVAKTKAERGLWHRMLVEYFPAFGADRARLEPPESCTNFLTVAVPAPTRAFEVREALMKRGIVVRSLEGYGLPHLLRVTVSLPAHRVALGDALEPIMKELTVSPAHRR